MLMSAFSSQENKKLIIVSKLLKIQWKLQKYKWYADSGATRQMYGTEKISIRLKNVTNSWTAEWVWEKCPYVKGIGDVYFKTHVGEKSSTEILNMVKGY
jgi:hypothetical protein